MKKLTVNKSEENIMNHKKISSIFIAAIMLTSLSLVVGMLPCATADTPYRVYGYVYDTSHNQIIPNNVSLSFPSQTGIQADLLSGGIYRITFDADPVIGEEGIFSVVYSGKTWTALETITVYGSGSIEKNLTINLSGMSSNSPPNIPSIPNPTNGATSVSRNKDLGWTGGDPDSGDVVTYDVYFGTSSPPSKISPNQSGTSYDTGTMSYNTKYYWKIVAWDDHGASAEGSIWSFTTKKQSTNSPTENNPVDTNSAPVAVINVSDSTVFIGETIFFDGNGSYDSDGDVFNWSWNFGDGNSAFGSTATHAYSQEGDFTVTLTIKDNQGKIDTETVTITVTKANIPPSDPEIVGPENGTKGTEYTFTVSSTDADNDTIQYITNWDDGETNETAFVANGTSADLIHSYATAGKYTITVRANDNETVSGTAQHIIYIDAIQVDNIGYLTDDDTDGTYDSFHNDTSAQETDVEKQGDGTYLLDDDGDGEWDWIYDVETETLSEYVEPTPDADNTALIVLAIIIILFLIVLGYLVKRNNDKKKAQKKEAEKKSQPKKKITSKKSKK